jgi:hypothetical protein
VESGYFPSRAYSVTSHVIFSNSKALQRFFYTLWLLKLHSKFVSFVGLLIQHGGYGGYYNHPLLNFTRNIYQKSFRVFEKKKIFFFILSKLFFNFGLLQTFAIFVDPNGLIVIGRLSGMRKYD